MKGVIMTVLFIIMGIFLIIGGFSCIFTPLLTVVQFGYMIVILETVYGIVGIIRAIVEKRFKLNFVFSILSVLLGVAMLAFPGTLLLVESVALMISAIWIIVLGVITVITSIAITRLTGSKIWILQLILGILNVLIGCYTFARPEILAVTTGVLIGIHVIETGVTMLFSVAAVSKD